MTIQGGQPQNPSAKVYCEKVRRHVLDQWIIWTFSVIAIFPTLTSRSCLSSRCHCQLRNLRFVACYWPFFRGVLFWWLPIFFPQVYSLWTSIKICVELMASASLSEMAFFRFGKGGERFQRNDSRISIFVGLFSRSRKLIDLSVEQKYTHFGLVSERALIQLDK